MIWDAMMLMWHHCNVQEQFLNGNICILSLIIYIEYFQLELMPNPLKQSGTKPNLVAKILATKFGVFFVIYIMFSKYVQHEYNDNVIKYYGSVIPHDWDVNFEKIWRATNCGRFLRKLTSKAGTNEFFKVWAPVSSVKCHSAFDVKLHWAQCVESNYSRREPFPIGEIYTTQIVSTLQMWTTIIGSHWQENQQRTLC